VDGRNNQAAKVIGLIDGGIIVASLDKGNFLGPLCAFASDHSGLIGGHSPAVRTQGTANGHAAVLLALRSAMLQASAAKSTAVGERTNSLPRYLKLVKSV
jgi:hypothetical protein